MPRMIVMSDRGLIKQVSLRAGKTTLGRDADNVVVIDSNRVSRRHAVLIKEGSSVSVRDLGSSNGTFVNDERVVCCRLEHGDTVVIGDYRLRFLEPVGARESATVTLDLASMHSSLASRRHDPTGRTESLRR
ncbi:FHA domain-containing protein [Variovorax sp. PAMC28562]|uniref:FHA domain-containing protein n=1 Tax=Variovorax sp. PAMC28562 TaxID=2762323 RepID=UPI00164E813D|nr:FHA domain-containing protein [Variovorax sp. PAMC28562]QNK72609.1 FHA domain-containing protein [Variovorax sp. PAMC28562]